SRCATSSVTATRRGGLFPPLRVADGHPVPSAPTGATGAGLAAARTRRVAVAEVGLDRRGRQGQRDLLRAVGVADHVAAARATHGAVLVRAVVRGPRAAVDHLVAVEAEAAADGLDGLHLEVDLDE